MAEYCDSIVMRIRGVDLDDVIISLKDNKSRKLSPVETLSASPWARGFKAGSILGTLQITAHDAVGDTVPDWDSLQRTGEEIESITKTPVANGVKLSPHTYYRCRVGDVNRSHSRGDGTVDVTIYYLQPRNPSPSQVI